MLTTETDAGRAKRGRLGRWFPFLYVGFTALLSLPILLPSYPPLVDYPNNLSRVDILSRYGEVEQFQKIYAIQREPIANLAIDLVVPPLARLIGIFPAGKVFLLLALAVYATGCYLLCGMSQGRTPWVALLLLCFFFNTAVTNGFMNYIAGVAIFLVAFACWLRWSSRWTAPRAAGFALLAFCCYFAHLSSIVMLGISVLAVWLWEIREGRPGVRSILFPATGFVVPGALFLIFMRGPGRIGSVGWNSLASKLMDIPVVVRTYNLPADMLLLAAAAICVLLCVRLASGVSVHTPTLIAGLALWLCFVVSPKDLFTSNAVDFRFVWPACVLSAAAFRPRVPTRGAAACLAILLALWTARAAALAVAWVDMGSRVAQMIRVLDNLPRGASLYPVTFAAPDFDTAKRDWVFRHVACYAAITRDAFVPSITAEAAQQPLVAKAGIRYVPGDLANAESWRGYDYVWTYKATAAVLSELESVATRVGGVADSGLWRLEGRGQARPLSSGGDALPVAQTK